MNWLGVKRIVAPLDPEDADERGIRIALDAVDASNVHVVVALSERLVGDVDERLAEARLRLRTWLAEQGFSDGIRTHVALGRPADVICDVAQVVDADLVVVPSHGRRGVPRLLLGSVAEEVVRNAPCPVLVLRRVVLRT